MEKEKVLLNLIEFLKKSGFKHYVMDSTNWWMDQNKRIEAAEKGYYFPLIFDHGFAQFVWKGASENGTPFWVYNLQRLALAENKLWYIEVEVLNKINNG